MLTILILHILSGFISIVLLTILEPSGVNQCTFAEIIMMLSFGSLTFALLLYYYIIEPIVRRVNK